MIRRYVHKALALGLAAVLIGLGVGGALAPRSAEAQQYRYWWQVVNEYGLPYPRGTVQCSVYRTLGTGTSGVAHVFTSVNDAGTGTTSALNALNNNSIFEFFWTSASDLFDVVCWTRTGDHARRAQIGSGVHRIVIDRTATRKVTRIPFHTNSTQTATGVYIPGGGRIVDVIIANLNPLAQGNPHLNVGFTGSHAAATQHALVYQQALTSGHPDGLWLRPHLVASVCAFTSCTFTTGDGGVANQNQGSHRGALLRIHHAANNFYLERPYLVHVATGLEVTYTTSAVAGLSGHIYILWDDLHTGVIPGWNTDQ